MSHRDNFPAMSLDPRQLGAVERAQKRLEELRREGVSRESALRALEEEYEQARVRLDALTGDRTVPAYQRTTSPLPRDLVESLEETIQRARAAREPES